MSNISKLMYERDGYRLLSENKEIAFSKCVNCFETNFFGINEKRFSCAKCGMDQTS